MQVFEHPHVAWWALYAITFAVGAIVHGWRIWATPGRAPTHLWLEMAGLALWSVGAIIGGMQMSGLAYYGGTSPYVRMCWVFGSVLLLGGGAGYLWRAWRKG